jgi:hypothetical protein
MQSPRSHAMRLHLIRPPHNVRSDKMQNQVSTRIMVEFEREYRSAWRILRPDRALGPVVE